uniref:Uncharacterized protein n=1 Tax=Aureoumbra lagunensis TaxID=44058 RepID=A0A7S3JYC3_9STRA
MRIRQSILIVLFVDLVKIGNGFVWNSKNDVIGRKRIVVRSDAADISFIKVIEAEASAQSSRLQVSANTRKRLNGAVSERTKAEALLRKALITAKEVLEIEAKASKERYEESIQAIAEYKKRQVTKKQLATTERELIESISSVVSMTPEPVIAERLSAVVEAKTEMANVDDELAQEYGQAANRLEEVANAATNDAFLVEDALKAFPSDLSDGSAIRNFDWSQVESVMTLLANIDAREESQKKETERLASVVTTLSKRRALAVAQAGDDSTTAKSKSKTPPSPIVGGLKSVTSSVATVAGAAADWILSDQPEKIADTISSRFKAKSTEPELVADVPKPESETEAEPELVAEVPKPESETEAEPELVAEVPKPESEAEAEPELVDEVPKPELETEAEPELVAEVPKPELETEAELVAEVPKPESEEAVTEKPEPEPSFSVIDDPAPEFVAEETLQPPLPEDTIDTIENLPTAFSPSNDATPTTTTTKPKKKKKTTTNRGFGPSK